MARVTRTECNGHWRSGRIRRVGDHCSFDSFLNTRILVTIYRLCNL